MPRHVSIPFPGLPSSNRFCVRLVRIIMIYNSEKFVLAEVPENRLKGCWPIPLAGPLTRAGGGPGGPGGTVRPPLHAEGMRRVSAKGCEAPLLLVSIE